MKAKIDTNDFYCTADCLYGGKSPKCHFAIRHSGAFDASECTANGECIFWHRKWPTPEQFWFEYSEKYPKNGAVYVLYYNEWTVTTLHKATQPGRAKLIIVCACTPFGKPDKKWRPK